MTTRAPAVLIVPKSSSLLCYTASSLHHITTDTQTARLLPFLKPRVHFPLNHVCFFCFQRINFDEINLHNDFKTFFLPQGQKNLNYCTKAMGVPRYSRENGTQIHGRASHRLKRVENDWPLKPRKIQFKSCWKTKCSQQNTH